MNLLIVSFDYPPILSPQAFRWGPIAKELVCRGHKVSVVAGWLPGAPRVADEDGVRVYRVGGGVTERLRKVYAERRESPATKQRAERSAGGLLNSFVRTVKYLHDATWKKVYWPDAQCAWWAPARACARTLIQQGSVDAMISVAFPYTSHLVGLSLNREYPHMRWLCDMSDPFTDLEPTPPNNRALYGRLNRRTERRIFERATNIVFHFHYIAGRYAELYSPWREKFAIVPYLHSAGTSGLATAVSSQGTKQPITRLAYVGTLDGRIRDPRPFLNACKRIKERNQVPGLEVHVYGHIENCETELEEYQPYVGKWLFLHGLVERRQAAAAVDSADVLVNIGNRYMFQVPSKLIDYGASGKPIVNLMPRTADLSRDCLGDYSAALHLVCEGASLTENQISEMEEFLKRRRPLDAAERTSWIQKFTLPRVVSGYERQLA